ncbi:hypothetical protein BD410DRAFT_841977 [Rickenella mellea]|uniref:Aminoglycoside phosphotransferase domain-containing protein n=1 Tax=Rickenella mellea TaxID=50990 RepID=A0A4Y7PYF0_9AGAM|nr:hypothetical protein BD410DRAFT_841977 [Rickenella mellea]
MATANVTTTFDSGALHIVIDNRPTGFPCASDILKLCRSSNSVGFPFPSSDQPTAWIKFGWGVTRGEALTQHKVALAMNTIPNTAVHVPIVYLAFATDARSYMTDPCGYIVMEFVPGLTVEQRLRNPDVNAKDMYQAVGRAVQQLIEYRAPSGTQPGPVGGGIIRHDFFSTRESAVAYRTVDILQDHVNRILKLGGYSQRVDFADETTDGLPLCLSDIHQSNWIIDDEGRVHAIDFGHVGFLPPSFVAYAIEQSHFFAKRVAKYVNYARSKKNLYAMEIAAGQLVLYGSSLRGLPRSAKELAKA